MSDADSARDQLTQLKEDHERLSAQVAQQAARISALESRMPGSAVSIPTSKDRARSAKAPSDIKQANSLERRIGGSWFNRIGIIAITLGVGFFLKYAFENEWIGPRGRVAAGMITGIAFLFAAERFRRRRYTNYANGLAGGAITIFYLSIFAAFSSYALIGQTSAFALMTLITLAAVLLAARFNAQVIAGLGLIGGFLTPAILSASFDQEAQLFGYIILLDVGVLALAYIKGWRGLNYGAFIATALLIVGWTSGWYQTSKLGVTIGFLSAVLIVFALIIVLNNIIARRAARSLDVGLLFGNALFFYAMSYSLLHAQYHFALSPLAVLLAACALALEFVAQRRAPDDALLRFVFLGAAIMFLTLAALLYFDRWSLTAAWAIEGATLAWLGLRANDRTVRRWALPVLALALANWAAEATKIYSFAPAIAYTPVFNTRFITGAILVACLGAAAWLYHQSGAGDGDDERTRGEKRLLSGILSLAAHAVALTVLSSEALDYFDQLSLARAGQLALSVIWGLYGGILLVIGVVRKASAIRVAALILLGATIIKVFLVDLSSIGGPYRIISFIVLGAILLAVSFFYQQKTTGGGQEKIN